eukprot:scaffold35107_cov28-Tisochrysis_lutea.AAC.7
MRGRRPPPVERLASRTSLESAHKLSCDGERTTAVGRTHSSNSPVARKSQGLKVSTSSAWAALQ